MTKIFVVTGNYTTNDYQYDWNVCAFTDRERAVECRNQLEAEFEKFKKNPPSRSEWTSPLDHQLIIWPGTMPIVLYMVEVLDLE